LISSSSGGNCHFWTRLVRTRPLDVVGYSVKCAHLYIMLARAYRIDSHFGKIPKSSLYIARIRSIQLERCLIGRVSLLPNYLIKIIRYLDFTRLSHYLFLILHFVVWFSK